MAACGTRTAINKQGPTCRLRSNATLALRKGRSNQHRVENMPRLIPYQRYRLGNALVRLYETWRIAAQGSRA
jgi:hypothetical protein